MKYRLFGMKPTSQNIARAARYGCYRATPGYLLVYTRGRKPPGSISVKAEELSEGDALWLRQCNTEIIRQTVNDSQDIQKNMDAFLARLEDELEKERTRLEANAVGG